MTAKNTFARLARAGTIMLALGLAATGAQSIAAAPQIRTQAPGYYRMMLGDFEVTALSDGTKSLSFDQIIHNIPAEDMTRLLAQAHLAEPVESSSAAYLVNTGSKLVLVDSGAGAMWDTTLGKVKTNLKAAGYRTDQVDMVLITHLHFDHVGGLVVGDKRAFPNAVVYVDKNDTDFWLSKDQRAKAPDQLKPWFDNAVKALKPYSAAGRLKTFTGSTEFLPGVTAIEMPGHTPGETSYAFESDGQKLVVWGDLVHLAAVQFQFPGTTIAFDVNEVDSAAQRRKAFADAAKEGYWTANSHIPFPGIGHVDAEGDHYRWVPANYVTIFPALSGRK